MSELILCCGKVCSGKSTFAAELQRRFGFAHFASDKWMLHFYEPTTDRALFDERLAKCEQMIYRVSEQILSGGGSVVLDAGFWKRSERAAVRARFEAIGHRVVVVYFPISLDRQLAYMSQRNETGASESYRFDRETILTLNSFFEEPAPEEWTIGRDEYLGSEKIG